MLGPSDKPRNGDMVFIDVKVLFRVMLAICREEMGLSEMFWFHKLYDMGQSKDKSLMKEQEKMLHAAKEKLASTILTDGGITEASGGGEDIVDDPVTGMNWTAK